MTRPALATALGCLGALATAHAAEYSLEPSVTAHIEHNDNIRMTTAPHESVSGASLHPSLKLKYATEITELSGIGSVNFRRYSRESELNATDVFLNGLGRRQFATGSLGLAADYTRDSTLGTELQETGLVLTRKQRNRVNLRPDWTWQMTERSALSLGYQYTDVSYQDGRAAGLLDYRNHAVFSSLQHDLSARDRVTGTLMYQQYRPSPSTQQADTTSLQAGYTHLFSETLRGTAGVGVARIESQGLPTGDRTTTRSLGNLSVGKQFETGMMSARLSREVAPSGSGGLAQTDRAGLEWTGKLQETLSLRLAGAAYRTRFVDVTVPGSNDSTYYQLEPRLTWNATREWALETGYNYARQKHELNPTAATGNTVYVNAIYNWPKQAISR